MKQHYTVRNFIEITLGVVIMSLGFYFFLLPADLVTGGVFGISILLSNVLGENSGFSPSVFLFICNGVLLVIGLLVLGKEFFFKTAYATILSPLITFILEITKVDPMLILNVINPDHWLLISSITGGLAVGVGLGIVLRNNATTGGIDVVQNILHKKLKVPFSLALYIIDGAIIISGAAYYIINSQFEFLFFAVISMFITGVVTDKLSLEGKAGYTFFIITENGHELTQAILTELDHGVTKVEAIGGYSNENKEMLVCTVFKQREYRIKEIVKRIDPSAFVFFMPTKEVIGEGFSKEIK